MSIIQPIVAADENSVLYQPLDIQLNVAVMHMANVVCPCGFDIVENAPSTFADLVAYIERHRSIVVYSGRADKTIYADREVNYCFRAWHAWCHWRGHHNFSLQGEIAVWEMQSAHLDTIYGASEITRRWRKVLYAETVGQSIFHATFGVFPEDQMAFTRNFLEHNCDATF